MNLLSAILFGKLPPARVRESWDDLYDEGKTMGTAIISRQGAGKTSLLCRMLVEDFLRHPNKAFFVLDSGGSDREAILKLIAQLPDEAREKAIKRIVLDEMGHPDTVVPLPEFSDKYGPMEEQTQRVSQNLVKLAPHLVKNAPFLAGLGLQQIAPHIFNLCSHTTNQHGESWQITEAKKFLTDNGLVRKAINDFGGNIPDTKFFLEKTYLEWKTDERELRSYAVTALLNMIEPREVRARLGYYRPGWIPREAIERGEMVIVDGSRLINQKNAQHYLFTQVYSLIMQEINRRIPSDPNNQPVALVMDEVYSLLSIPGMAEEVGMLSPLYRSRKLELYIVLQTLSQLAEPLDKQIWSLGNKVIGAIENKNEAEEIARQLFKYNPKYLKQPARNPNQNIITEPEHGQDRIIADWIQNLEFREFLMRRFVSERQVEEMVVHVPKSRPLPSHPPYCEVWELEEMLLKARGVPVRDALEIINQRKISNDRRPPPQV